MEGGEIKRTQNRKIANERKKPEEKSGGVRFFQKAKDNCKHRKKRRRNKENNIQRRS